jgi:hypothetical protein
MSRILNRFMGVVSHILKFGDLPMEMPHLSRETRHPHSGDAILDHWRCIIFLRYAHPPQEMRHPPQKIRHLPLKMRVHLQNPGYVTLLIYGQLSRNEFYHEARINHPGRNCPIGFYRITRISTGSCQKLSESFVSDSDRKLSDVEKCRNAFSRIPIESNKIRSFFRYDTTVGSVDLGIYVLLINWN